MSGAKITRTRRPGLASGGVSLAESGRETRVILWAFGPGGMCGIGMGMGVRGLERRTARMNHLSPWAGRNKSAHLSCIGETCHALCRCDAESALVSGGDGDSAPLPLVGMGPLVGCVWDRVGNTVLGLSGIGFWVGVGYMGGAWGGV